MPQQGSYKISVGLVDNASSGLAKINAQIAAARKPMDQLQKQMDRFGKVSGISKLHEQTTKLLNPIEKAGKLFAGLFGMGSIAGIIATTRQFAELSNEIQRTAASLGVATNKLQTLQDTGRLLGTGSSSMGNMLQTIQNNQLSMRFGGDGDLQTIYQKLHLSQRDSATTVRNRTLDYVHDHLTRGDVDPAILRQLSQKMLGTTDYMGMSSKQVEQAEQRAKFLGRYNEDNVKNANKLRESYQGVLTAINGVTQTIIGRLAPKLSPLLDKFANWLAGPQADKVINKIVDGVMKLAEWLQKVDWKGVSDKIAEWYKWLGGFKGIVEILIGLKLASWFGGAAIGGIKLFSALSNIGKLSVFGKLKDFVGLKAGSGMLGFLGGVLKGLTRIAAVLGIIKTGYDLFQDSKIKNTYDRHEAYGKHIGQAVGAIAGGALGSVLGPAGTVVGGAAGAWLGGKAGEMAADWISKPHPEILNDKQRAGRAQYLQQQLMNAGLTKNQATGFMGNIAQESNFNASARGDGGKAFGLMQWHKDRVEQIYKGTGVDVRTANYADQVKAAVWEMKHGDAGAQKQYQMMLKNKDMSVSDAAGLVNKLNERSADALGQEKQWRTQKALAWQHSIDVNFNNAPQGMTASAKTDSSSGVKLNTPKIKQARTPTMSNGLV